MKHLTYLSLFIFLGTFCHSCTNDDSNPDPNHPTQIQNIVQGADWVITKMVDSGQDETSDFQGFVFRFETNGDLVSTNGTQTYTGTWSVTQSGSNDDEMDDVDFNIFFNETNSFEDLNDDWDVVEVTNNKIELMDISGGNGGTDFLTFEK